MHITLDRGERGIIIGQTGSGKTVGAIWHMRAVAQWPVIIFDTKIEPAFNAIREYDSESIELIDSGSDFLAQWKSKKQPDYLVVRPTADELSDPLELDNLLYEFYGRGRSAFVYIDEAYQWHNNGRAGAGLIGLLTRGRSKKMTTLISSQRPSWISRFCFSEAQKYYIYKLGDRRDLQSVGNFVPDIENVGRCDKRKFWYYEPGSTDKPLYFNPVEYTIGIDKEKFDKSGKRWI